MKFSSEALTTNQYGSSNKYGDAGFSSGGTIPTESSQSSNYGSNYGSTYGSTYESYQPSSSSSNNNTAEPGIPTNIKIGLGLGVIGAAVMMYKPNSGAKIIKQASEASKTAKKADFKSVAEQMQAKLKSTTSSTKTSENPSSQAKTEESSGFDFGSIMDKVKNSFKDTKNMDKSAFSEKFAADKKVFDEKFQKQFDDLRKDADKHFSKAMSEESKATAEEQKKQMKEAMNKTTEFLNKAFASAQKSGESAKTDKTQQTASSGESIFEKLSKEIGMADFFDKHESGGFEPSDDKKGMSLQEARKILQFDASNPNIKKDEITKNFRIISRQNHPDLGGSAYLASKVNEARETLLKHNKKTQRRR